MYGKYNAVFVALLSEVCDVTVKILKTGTLKNNHMYMYHYWSESRTVCFDNGVMSLEDAAAMGNIVDLGQSS